MASAIFHHAMTMGQTSAAATLSPLDSGSSGTSGTSGTSGSSGSGDSGDSATISANDFLTLLVTEMQNQDPTQDTDPNEYIDQLVQVNSLEQLIDINQTLTTGLDGGSGSTSGSGDSTSAAGGPAAPESSGGATSGAMWKTAVFAPSSSAGGSSAQNPLSALGASGATPIGAPEKHAHGGATLGGNLSIPQANPSATRVAHALAGRTHAAETRPVTATN